MKERLSGHDSDDRRTIKRFLAMTAVTMAAFPLNACAHIESAHAEPISIRIDIDNGPNLVIGDSLTDELSRAAAGEFASDLKEPNGLPYDIPQEGVFKGGATSLDIQRMLSERGSLERRYEAAVVEIGINDAMATGMVPTVTTDGYTPQDRKNITTLYENVAAKSKCVVAVMPSYNVPVLDVAYFGQGIKIRTELDKVRQDLQETIIPDLKSRGAHIEVADPHPFVQTPGSTSHDGVHARPLFEQAPPEAGRGAFKARTNVVKAALARCEQNFS